MKEAMILFGDDEIEARDKYAAAALPVVLARHPDDGLGVIAEESFDIAEAMIVERRRRTTYTCLCGKVALTIGSERCPACAAKVCVRCKKPFGELHHVCISEVRGADL